MGKSMFDNIPFVKNIVDNVPSMVGHVKTRSLVPSPTIKRSLALIVGLETRTNADSYLCISLYIFSWM